MMYVTTLPTKTIIMMGVALVAKTIIYHILANYIATF